MEEAAEDEGAEMEGAAGVGEGSLTSSIDMASILSEKFEPLVAFWPSTTGSSTDWSLFFFSISFVDARAVVEGVTAGSVVGVESMGVVGVVVSSGVDTKGVG